MCAFIAVGGPGEVVGLVGVHPGNDLGPPRGSLSEQPAQLTTGCPGRGREFVRRWALFLCRFQTRRGTLSACDLP